MVNRLRIFFIKKDKDWYAEAIMFTVFVSVLIYSMYNTHQARERLKTNFAYVIGTYVDIEGSAEGSPSAIFTFIYNGKNYKNPQTFDCRKPKLQSRFYLRIVKDDPKISRVLYRRPVPDSIISQPALGWQKIPAIDSTKIPPSECIEEIFRDADE